MCSLSSGSSLGDVDSMIPWAVGLSTVSELGGGGQFPCEPSRECHGALTWGAGSPRSSTGINSLKDRGKQQREQARVLEPTVPTRDSNTSCGICKTWFPLSPEAEGRVKTHSELCPWGVLMEYFITTEFTKASQSQMSFPGGTGVKNMPAKAGHIRYMSSIPGPGRSPGARHGNLL